MIMMVMVMVMVAVLIMSCHSSAIRETLIRTQLRALEGGRR
jgi:hypothetical protein